MSEKEGNRTFAQLRKIVGLRMDVVGSTLKVTVNLVYQGAFTIVDGAATVAFLRPVMIQGLSFNSMKITEIPV